MKRLLSEDIDFVLTEAGAALESLRGTRILITGGTGFFGRWLIECLLAANAHWGLGLKLVVLSRSPEIFVAEMPHLGSHPDLTMVQGNILELSAASLVRQLGPSSHVHAVVHLVTEADQSATRSAPLEAMRVIVDGTRQALDVARLMGAKRFLFTSSGAVYGPQPPGMLVVGEDACFAPLTTDLDSAYGAAGNAKRYAELLCAAYTRQHGIETVIARCFTFVGPHLPLTGKFAVGNFLDSARRGENLLIKGDGTPVRSYFYAADLTAWLLTLLTRGAPGQAYNVGSEQPITIEELAHKVVAAAGLPLAVKVLGRRLAGSPGDRYVPSTARAAKELGLHQKIPLDAALERTFRWLRLG